MTRICYGACYKMSEETEKPKDTPSQITATFRDGVVQFRHPWFKNKVIRFGVARFVPGDQARWCLRITGPLRPFGWVGRPFLDAPDVIR